MQSPAKPPGGAGAKRCSLRGAASWGTGQGEAGRSGSGGAIGQHPARKENLQVMKSSLPVHSIPVFNEGLTDVPHLL